MGEQIELLCSETSPANDGKDLNEIFISRFQLPASFWNDLFDSNCPEGLGKVNEKLKNGDELIAADFSRDEYSTNEEGQQSKNEENGNFKTPILVKSLSNANYSPPLFSPLSQDCKLSRGPSSSTPIPGKLVNEAAFTITPRTTKDDGQNIFFTPEHKLLDFTAYKTKAKMKKLSASLAMDPSEQMNLSWSSSLATPPGPGCPKQQSVNFKTDQICIQEACSFERSTIPWQEMDTMRMEDPLEQLDTIKVEIKSKPKHRGVARILFEKEIQSFREDTHANKDDSFKNSDVFVGDSTYKKPKKIAHGCSLNQFDMSSLSPLQDKDIKEIFALTESGNITEGRKKNSNVKFQHDENHANGNLSSDCVKEQADEACGRDCDNIKAVNKDVETDDFKNFIDMDNLSEFSMDFDLSQYASTSDQVQKTHPVESNLKSNNDQPDQHSVSNKKTESDGKDLNIDVSKISQTNQQFNDEVNECERKPVTTCSAYDMDALSEFSMDCGLSQLIDEPSTCISNEGEKLHSEDNNVKSNNDNQDLESTGLLSVPNEKAEALEKSNHRNQFVDGSKNLSAGKLIVSNEMNKPEAKPLYDDSVYDMDALSEFPMDSGSSQLIDGPGTSNEGEKIHSEDNNVKSDNDNQDLINNSDLHSVSNGKKSSHEDQFADVSKISKINEMNTAEAKPLNDNNIYDMDALSEFPVDSGLSQLIDGSGTSSKGEKIHSKGDNVKSDKDNQELTNNSYSHSVSNEKTEAIKKNSHKSQFVDVSKITKTNEINTAEVKPFNDDNVYDMDALSELPIDGLDDLSQPDNGNSNLNGVNKCDSDVPVGQNRTSPKKMEGTTQVLQPTSLQLLDVGFDKHVQSNAKLSSQIIPLSTNAEQDIVIEEKEVKKNLTDRNLEDEQCDKLKTVNSLNMKNCQNVNSLQPFQGFSTASGKKLTISEKSMHRARKFLNEVNETNNFLKISSSTNVNANVSSYSRKNVQGDIISKCPSYKPSKEIVNIGFCVASGKKADVSLQSLQKARQIQEETRCVEVPGNSLAPDLRKCEEQTFTGTHTNLEETLGKQRPNTRNNLKFSTNSGKEIRISEKSLSEAKSILDDVQHMPDLSDDFLKDVEKVFADLENETCPSNVGNIQVDKLKAGMNEDEGEYVDCDIACVEEKKDLNNTKHTHRGTFVNSDNVNYGLLSTSEKDLTLSQKVTKQNELDGKQSDEVPNDPTESQMGTLQKNVTGKSHGLHEINMKPNVVCTAAESISGEAEKTSKNSFSIPNISDNSENKTTVLEENRDVISERQGNRDGENAIPFFTGSGKSVEISQDTVKLSKQTSTEFNIGKIGGQELNELLATKNTPSVFTTASGNKVTIATESMKKAKEILGSVKCEDYPEERRRFNELEKFGFSTASGNAITISEESLKKAQRILNDVNKEERCQKEVVNRRQNIALSNVALKSKPKGFTAFSIQKARLRDTESKECCKSVVNKQLSKLSTSLDGISVPVELQKEPQITVDEVDNEERKAETENDNIPCSTETVYINKPAGFTTASGKNIPVSEMSVQKAKSLFNDKESDDFSKKEELLSMSPKFALSTASGKGINGEESMKKAKKILNEEDDKSKERRVNEKIGFCTASGNKITISEESLQKAQKILNEVHDEEYPKGKKASNVEHKTSCSTNAHVGFVTASRTNTVVSEESIRNVNQVIEEGKSLRMTTKFGFSTASGCEIKVSEEALKNARKILDESNNTQPELHQKLGKASAAERNVQNCREAANLLDDSNPIDYKSEVQIASMFHNDVARLGSLSDKTISTPKQTEKKDNEYRKAYKRLSSEVEIEDGRACKAFRTDEEMETLQEEDKRKWTRFKSFDPLVSYKDRKRSNSKSPLRTNLQNSNQASCDQVADVKTPINNNSEVIPGSHFTTPYRDSQKTPFQKPSERNFSSNKKTKNTKQNNKARSVKPQPGSMYNMKTNACFKSRRISMAEYVRDTKQQTDDEPNYGINPSVLSVTCENADSYRFELQHFGSEDLAAHNTGVTCTEGAVLFLGDDKCVGLAEFTKAFLSSPGVDSKLISEAWLANHYKWIVWKLASYEKSYPQLFSGRALTPDIVLSQLKYRYDREIDHCERSAIKRILERDDSSSRSMVLCVASLDETDLDASNESKSYSRSRDVEAQKVILMTDGWYSVRVQLDEHLQNLVKERKIYIGQKLYIQGAELRGSDQAVSPLEAPANLSLRIHGNSTRPAKKFSRLGFHCKNNMFTVPIKSISTVGGLVGSINVIVVRQYPLQFMEKLPDGKCIFRNPRLEERVAKIFEDDILRKREKIMLQVEKEIENEEKTTTRETKRRKSDCLSTNQIENLSDGKQIFDAINNASDPFRVQKCLSGEQRRNLDHYKENLNNDRASIVRRKYEEAWSKLSEEETLKRDVIPVLKVKLVDCFPSKTNQAPGTALLTVWRPSEQTITTLGERNRLKIYNLQVSKYKGNSTMQLSTNRSTIYKSLPSDATFQNTFEGRKVFKFQEISKGLRPYVEVDVVAVVISQFCQHNLTLVFVADSNFNFVRIKVWGGLESHGLQDVMREKNFVAACNLLSQPDKRSGIPSLKYCELSLVTSNPSIKMLRNSLYELRRTVSNTDSFMKKAKAKLDELCSSNWSTPKLQTMSPGGKSSESTGKRRRNTETPSTLNRETDTKAVSNGFTPLSSKMAPRQIENTLQSRKRLLVSKRRKLELLGDPPPLSPIPNALPVSVRKAFQVPRRIKTQVDDTENEEE